jgi:2-succinyl-6-hydroxy-2,4-cyclohexadiene-1-carboxylate synthase
MGSDAAALVLLHGFTHTAASWAPVIAELEGRPGAVARQPDVLAERPRVLAPDIRGHGLASATRPVTLEAVLADLARLPAQRLTLAGYSMGGRIALHAALARPERIERLVLIGASPGIEDPEEREARLAQDELLAGEIERSSIELFARRWARTAVLDDQPDAVRRAAHADRLRNTTGGLAAALRGLGTGALAPVWGRLGELEMPVLLIVGERDGRFRALAEQMAQRIADAGVAVVAGAGHAVHLEAPRQVAAVLLASRAWSVKHVGRG